MCIICIQPGEEEESSGIHRTPDADLNHGLPVELVPVTFQNMGGRVIQYTYSAEGIIGMEEGVLLPFEANRPLRLRTGTLYEFTFQALGETILCRLAQFAGPDPLVLSTECSRVFTSSVEWDLSTFFSDEPVQCTGRPLGRRTYTSQIFNSRWVQLLQGTGSNEPQTQPLRNRRMRSRMPHWHVSPHWG